MKEGPATFQCACFTWVKRSTTSASRACSNAMTWARTAGSRSMLVRYMGFPDDGGRECCDHSTWGGRAPCSPVRLQDRPDRCGPCEVRGLQRDDPTLALSAHHPRHV